MKPVHHHFDTQALCIFPSRKSAPSRVSLVLADLGAIATVASVKINDFGAIFVSCGGAIGCRVPDVDWKHIAELEKSQGDQVVVVHGSEPFRPHIGCEDEGVSELADFLNKAIVLAGDEPPAFDLRNDVAAYNPWLVLGRRGVRQPAVYVDASGDIAQPTELAFFGDGWEKVSGVVSVRSGRDSEKKLPVRFKGRLTTLADVPSELASAIVFEK